MNRPSNTTTFNPAVPTEMKIVAQVVLNGLQSPKSKWFYKMVLRDFLNYWAENGSPVPDKLFLQTYVFHMLETGVGKVSINIRLAAIKTFSREAADMNIWPYEVPTAFSRVKKIAVRGTRSGTWLTMEQAQSLMNVPDISKISGLRDRALLSVLLGCGLRRSEAVSLTVEHIQQRNNSWVLANILGKRNKIWMVVIPAWTKNTIDAYLAQLEISTVFLFRPMSKNGTLINEGYIRQREVARIVRTHAAAAGFSDIAP